MTVFLNPHCSYGTGRSRWEKVESILRQRIGKFSTQEIRSPEEIDQQVNRVLRNGESVLIAAGGDGTVNLLLNAIMNSDLENSKITLGAVGLGSSNDFHKPFRSEAFIEGIPVKVQVQDTYFCDVIRIQYQDIHGQRITRFCLNNASIGITAQANAYFNSRAKFIKAVRKLSVEAAIVASALRTIFNYRGISCIIALDGGKTQRFSVTNLGIIKNPHFAGSLCYDNPVKSDDGNLGVNLCDDMSLIETIKVLFALSKRRFQNRPKTKTWLASQVSVESDQQFDLEMDGEVIKTMKADFTVIPQAVRCCR